MIHWSFMMPNIDGVADSLTEKSRELKNELTGLKQQTQEAINTSKEQIQIAQTLSSEVDKIRKENELIILSLNSEEKIKSKIPPLVLQIVADARKKSVKEVQKEINEKDKGVRKMSAMQNSWHDWN